MFKLKHADGGTSVNWRGHPFAADAEGFISVPGDAVAELAAHGWHAPSIIATVNGGVLTSGVVTINKVDPVVAFLDPVAAFLAHVETLSHEQIDDLLGNHVVPRVRDIMQVKMLQAEKINPPFADEAEAEVERQAAAARVAAAEQAERERIEAERLKAAAGQEPAQ
jgi:hypothetical protein